MQDKLRVAIQKDGRLSEKSVDLIKECGIGLGSGKGKLKAASSDFPLEVLYLRDDDIPGYVADGVADIGIVGENVKEEKQEHVDLIKRLGFSKCRLSIGVARDYNYQKKEDLNGLSIATSYPNLLGDYLKREGIDAEIHEISGSVEIAPSIGLSDAVCDIVSSGGTLISNGLKEAETIFRSEAVLIGNPDMDDARKELMDNLLFRIEAVLRAEKTKYILLNAPNDAIDQITDILPGVKSPTVMPLAQEGWSSLHSVVREQEFWEIIGQLKEAGAEGILVIPIEKIIQ